MIDALSLDLAILGGSTPAHEQIYGRHQQQVLPEFSYELPREFRILGDTFPVAPFHALITAPGHFDVQSSLQLDFNVVKPIVTALLEKVEQIYPKNQYYYAIAEHGTGSNQTSLCTEAGETCNTNFHLHVCAIPKPLPTEVLSPLSHNGIFQHLIKNLAQTRISVTAGQTDMFETVRIADITDQSYWFLGVQIDDIYSEMTVRLNDYEFPKQLLRKVIAELSFGKDLAEQLYDYRNLWAKIKAGDSDKIKELFIKQRADLTKRLAESLI